ncbi:MAG: hypothetical protein ABI306_10330, partial [Caulobacteraceae bacterium]
LGVAVVTWPAVFNVRKYSKFGRWRGFLSEIAMMRDALSVLSPWGVVRQNFGLLRLMKTHPARLAARRPQSDFSFDISFCRYFLIR